MLSVGDALPTFDLPDQHGDRIRSGDLRGAWVLVYWYPKADTPGCTAQAQSLRDQHDAFDELGCRVLGASFDDVDDLEAFAAKESIGFSLVSDVDRAVGRSFGVAGGDGLAEHASRTAFLFDADATLVRVYDVDDPSFFAEGVLDDLEAFGVDGP